MHRPIRLTSDWKTNEERPLNQPATLKNIITIYKREDK